MAENTLEIDNPLQRLESKPECVPRAFECRNFAALGERETADVFGINLCTSNGTSPAAGWPCVR